MATDKFKEWGRQGGAARAANVSPEDRARIAREAAQTRWDRERDKPTPEHVIKAMLAAIERDGRPRMLFRRDGVMFHEARDTAAAARWVAELSPEGGVLGTFDKTSRFLDVLLEVAEG